jgi:hypothetical protein
VALASGARKTERPKNNISAVRGIPPFSSATFLPPYLSIYLFIYAAAFSTASSTFYLAGAK